MRQKLKRARKLEFKARKLKKSVKFLKKRLSANKIREMELKLKRAELKHLIVNEEITAGRKVVATRKAKEAKIQIREARREAEFLRR